MKERFLNLNIDSAGFAVSFLCAIHCLALPFLLTFTTISGVTFLENQILELVIISTSVLIASYSILKSLKVHKNQYPLVLIIIGFSSLFIGQTITENLEFLFSSLGGFTIAFAHYKNWRLSQSCKLI